MSFIVQLRNFQSLSKADYSFNEGLNVIVGPSNSGKTALFRALQSALFNLPVDAYVKQGEPKSQVGIKLDNSQVIWQRSLTSSAKTLYKVNGLVINKPGRNQLKEVADALKIEEIDVDGKKYRLNFIKQMAFPFLLDETPSTVYRFLVNSAESENLTSVLDLMKKDQKKMQIQKSNLESVIDELKTQYMETVDLIEQEKPKQDVINKVLQSKQIFDSVKDVQNLLRQINLQKSTEAKIKLDLTSLANKLKAYPDVDQDILNLESLHNLLLDIKDTRDAEANYSVMIDRLPKIDIPNIDEDISKVNTLSELISLITRIKTDIKSVAENIKDVPKIHCNEQDITKVLSLDSLLNDIGKINFEKAKVLQAIRACSQELEQVNNQLNEFDVCPVCGRKLEG